jgi:glutamate synthase domain-containing protein 3
MTGGVAFVWDPKAILNRYLAETSPANRRLLDMERLELHDLIDSFSEATSSPVAKAILDDWDRQADRFWVLRASKPITVLEPAAVGAGAVSGN